MLPHITLLYVQYVLDNDISDHHWIFKKIKFTTLQCYNLADCAHIFEIILYNCEKKKLILNNVLFKWVVAYHLTTDATRISYINRKSYIRIKSYNAIS